MLALIFALFLSISFSQTLFFSEYAEGTSNNKYLEIYNPTAESIDLTDYAFPNSTNGADSDGSYDYWNDFDSGTTVEPGDVFVICHGSADALIQAECDQHHTYLSNGNDGFCLVQGSSSSFDVVDCIGTWSSEDPGNGWDVAGVSDATKDHTLVRKDSVTEGNQGDWELSAGTNDSDSEWIVYDQNTWDYLGYHNEGGSEDTGGGDDGIPVAEAGDNQVVDFSDTVTLDGSGSYDSDGVILGYSWNQVSGPSVDIDNYEQAIITFTAPDDYCVLEFSLQVFDDGFNYSSVDYVTVTVGSISIYDIQYTEEQGQYCYETEMSGAEVTVTGVVTHVKPGNQFFLQDPDLDTWAGIYVYDTTVNPAVGDKLSISASVNEYYSLTQLLDVTSSTVISTGNDIAPILVDASDIGIECSASGEMYESMLVEVRDITFNSVDEFGNWAISDNSGSTMVDDYYYDDSLGSWPTLSIEDVYDCLSGVVSYSYSEFKIYPRTINDFSCSEGCTADGDVNGDMNIDVLDIVSIVGYVLGNNDFTSDELCVSDVNQDSNVDVLDIVSIVNSILGNN